MSQKPDREGGPDALRSSPVMWRILPSLTVGLLTLTQLQINVVTRNPFDFKCLHAAERQRNLKSEGV